VALWLGIGLKGSKGLFARPVTVDDIWENAARRGVEREAINRGGPCQQWWEGKQTHWGKSVKKPGGKKEEGGRAFVFVGTGNENFPEEISTVWESMSEKSGVGSKGKVRQLKGPNQLKKAGVPEQNKKKVNRDT